MFKRKQSLNGRGEGELAKSINIDNIEIKKQNTDKDSMEKNSKKVCGPE